MAHSISSIPAFFKEQSYIYEIDRKNLEEVCQDNEKISFFKLLKEVFGQLRPDMPLYRMILPSILIAPVSQLEKTTHGFWPNNYFRFLKNTEEERFLSVLRWRLSTLNKFPRDGIKCSKPYNPIIGEIFRCKWEHDDSTTFFFAVSHHPPKTAYHMLNPKMGVCIHGSFEPSVKLHINSLSVIMKGKHYLDLIDYHERYDIEIGDHVMTNGLFLGKTNVKISGKQRVYCKETGYRCDMNIKNNKYNTINGIIYGYDGKKLYKIDGSITGIIDISNLSDGTKETFIDYEDVKGEEMKVIDISKQKENESRRVWHKVSFQIYKKDYSQANYEKFVIEERQRAKRRKRKKDKIQFEPKYFLLNKNNEEEAEYVFDKKLDFVKCIQEL